MEADELERRWQHGTHWRCLMPFTLGHGIWRGIPDYNLSAADEDETHKSSTRSTCEYTVQSRSFHREQSNMSKTAVAQVVVRCDHAEQLEKKETFNAYVFADCARP